MNASDLTCPDCGSNIVGVDEPYFSLREDPMRPGTRLWIVARCGAGHTVFVKVSGDGEGRVEVARFRSAA